MASGMYSPTGECLYTVDNFGTNPSATPGSAVTPSTSSGAPSYSATLLTAAQDLAGLYLRVSDGGATGRNKGAALTIGIDRAGGTSFSDFITNIICGDSGSLIAGVAGHRFFFPIRVPASSTLAVKIRCNDSVAADVQVGLKGYGQLSGRHLLPSGLWSESLGTLTNSDGVTFTPGNAADGTWVSLGTLAKAAWWFQLGYQVSGTAVTAERTWVELGAGASGSQRVLLRRGHAGTATEQIGDMLDTQLIWHEGYHELQAGTELWVRGRCENAPDTTYNAIAVTIGG